MAVPPRLTPGNLAVEELCGWLEGQREAARTMLETETEMSAVLRLQGRVALLAELLQAIDPAHRRYGERGE